jgi:phosphoglycerate dehydrogenase-like enzyme
LSKVIVGLWRDRPALIVTEPMPAERPLWNLENIFITPHVSENFEQDVERVGAQFAENLARYLRGEALVNVVDKNMGY